MNDGLEAISKKYLRLDLAICPICYRRVEVRTVRRATGIAERTCPHCGAGFRVEIGPVDVTTTPARKGEAQ